MFTHPNAHRHGWMTLAGLALCAVLFGLPAEARAWQEQPVLEYIVAHNPVLKAYRSVANEYRPATGMEQMLEHASVYWRLGTGGTDFRDEAVLAQAGVQISIPLASPKERRAWAEKALEQTRAVDEVRAKALADIAALRHHEADLKAARAKLKFLKDKSAHLQKRVDHGYETQEALWLIAQQLEEQRAKAERFAALIASQQYQVAHHAGPRWRSLLQYLQGQRLELRAE